MKLLKNLLLELEQYGLRADFVQPGSADLGSDLAMPCFDLAKQQRQSPQAIAEAIAKQLKHEQIQRVVAVNGYLNLWLKSQFLAQTLFDLQPENQPLGQQAQRAETVIIEYFSPNLAKPLSVGHLRNIWQGRALTNLHRVFGYHVITDNHIGDWGTVFGIWVVGFLKFGNQQQLEEHGVKELGRIYVLTQQALKEEAATGQTTLKDEVQAWLLKLEAQDAEAWRYHQLFSAISQTEMTAVLQRLGINFDETLGESFYQKLGRDVLRQLEERGVAQRQADQSVIVDLTPEDIKTPLVIQKSNGATLYATSDLATLVYRQQRWQPQRVIYVVGQEQKFYFRQIFACNRLARLTDAELIHHAYGLIEERDADSGQRQKMSSRKRAVYLQDILQQAYQMATQTATKDLSATDIEKIAQGALIFQEFTKAKQHNVLFDWQKIFSFSDMSGPYVQYATLRLQSLLNKANTNQYQVDTEYDWQAEHKLLFKLLTFEDVLADAFTNLELQRIGSYIFELTKELNRYYDSNRILEAEPAVRDSRLYLMHIIYQHLCFTLKILGIQLPSRM